MNLQAVAFSIITIFVQSVKLQDLQGNEAPSGEGFLIHKIETRLRIASKMVDTARRELRNDLRQICRNCSCSRDTFGCSKAKTNYLDWKPMDCADIYNGGYRTNGIYQIWPQSRIFNGSLLVFCDMEDGGGWTIVQRRGDFGNAMDYFFQDWNKYKTGFGHLLREFWIGNDNLFTLTNQRSYKLKLDLTTWDEEFKYATYGQFRVDDEVQNYTLHVDTYEGTAGNELRNNNGEPFRTKDSKGDSCWNGCAVTFRSAWWFPISLFAHFSNLNGLYRGNASTIPSRQGIYWGLFGRLNSLKEVIMKIRPTGFNARAAT